MDNDFQAKIEKCEAKAAKYREAGQKVAEGAQRSMYEVLATYYGSLATDFRQVVEKRSIA
jgi:hypothetical protein